jgi:hypothetical protein
LTQHPKTEKGRPFNINEVFSAICSGFFSCARSNYIPAEWAWDC